MTNGAVTCRVRLDRGGYVPGEAISIWATITNNSRVTIKHTRASLTEVTSKKNYMMKMHIYSKLDVSDHSVHYAQ